MNIFDFAFVAILQFMAASVTLGTVLGSIAIYACLGLPPELELRDRLDRPFALVPWGQPIRTLRS